MEIKVIKHKFQNAYYPSTFLNKVIHQFFTRKNNSSCIIPPDLFEESKPFILVEIPFCKEKQNATKYFIKKFETFTNQCYRIVTKWITRKVKSLFKVKSKTPHPSFVIYRGKCSCEKNILKRHKEMWKNVGANIKT